MINLTKSAMRAILTAILLSWMFALSCSDENPTDSGNNPPLQPTIGPVSSTPPHESVGQSITPTLHWDCSDPDGDALQYDVYIGSLSTPPLVSSNQPNTNFTPGTLEYSRKYYWKVIAKDSKGASTSSVLWSFTTKSAPIENIITPNRPSGADSGLVRQSLNYATGGSSSSLGHSIEYKFAWDDGNYSGWSSTNASHAWSQPGTFSIKSQARCATHTNIVSSWSNATSVAISEVEEPVLAVSPSALNFDSSKTNLSFTITNTGAGTLSWSISDNQDWITYNPMSGSTTTEVDEVLVSVDRSGLSPGIHTGTVSISSNGGDFSIGVSMTVLPDPPICSVSPTNLDFGEVKVGESKLLSFTITNMGGGTLSGSVDENCNQYRVVSGPDVYNLSNGESAEFTVMFSPTTEGVDTCTILTQNVCMDVSLSGNGIKLLCSIDINRPNYLDEWVKGENHTIIWDSENASSNVIIELVKEHESWIEIIDDSASNIGSYSWIVNDFGHGEGYNYRIRITDFKDKFCYSRSEFLSIIVQEHCSITVTSPALSDIWTKGTQQTIGWNKDNCSAPDVDILLSKGLFSGGFIVGIIAHSTPNDGSYSWTVDDFGGGTYSDYHIFVVDSIDITSGGYTEAFTIVNNDPITITLNATADADISSNYPDINGGSFTTMLVGKTMEDGSHQSYLRFDELLNSIPLGASIQSAELLLTRRYWEGDLILQVTPINRNWLESTITWNAQPGEAASPQTIINADGGSNPVQISINITDHVQDLVSEVRLNYGFVLWAYGPVDFEDVVQFYTRESSTSSYRPKLTITYKSP